MSNNWLGYDLLSSTYGVGNGGRGPVTRGEKIFGTIVIVIMLCVAGYFFYRGFDIFAWFFVGASVLILSGMFEL